MTHDDLYVAGLRTRPLSECQPRVCPPVNESWWTVAETGERFTVASRRAWVRQRITEGLKVPDRRGAK